MKYWSRSDTKHWVAQLENRIEDIEYYLGETIDWCERNDIYREDAVFSCMLMTVLWVSTQRSEPLSKREAMELLGVSGWEQVEDEEFVLGAEYADSELGDLLEQVCQKLF
jgi:hypothetical protein